MTAVIKHEDDSKIRELINGSVPKVYSEDDDSRCFDVHPPDSASSSNPRLSQLNSEYNNDYDNIPFSSRPIFDQTRKFYLRKSHLQDQVDQSVVLIKSVSEKINAFEQLQALKSIAIHQEFEENFLTPIQNRIKNSLGNERYLKFLKKKNNSIAELDEDPTPIHSSRIPKKLESVHFSINGIQDPISRFAMKKRKEQDLIDFLDEANHCPPKKKKPETDKTLDYRFYRLQSQTRFFGSEEPPNTGRKYFTSKNASNAMKVAIDTFV